MTLEASSLALTGIRHAFFTRDGGVSGGFYASLNGGIGSRDAADKVAENRARMAAALGVEPRRFLTAFQTHSPNVVVAESPWTADTRPRADAIVTKMRALAIGITTADCGPILLADPKAHVIGAAHAGWRGALSGVIEATVEAFTALQSELKRERRAMERIWSEREKQIERVIANTAGMYGEVRGIVGSSVLPVPALELEAVAGMLEDMTAEMPG